MSLALSGGAARGAFHLGFIQALQENAVDIKAISGTSAGAIVGGAIACGVTPKEVLEILKSKEFKAIFKFNWFRSSVFSIDYGAKVIQKLFPVLDIKDAEIPFYACVADLTTNEVLYANSGSGVDYVLASSSLIPIFEPYPYDSKMLVDGGFLELMPTLPLVKHGYPILGINLLPHKTPQKYNFFTLLANASDMLFRATLPQDVKRCEWYVSPDALSNLSLFSLSKLDQGFDFGYAEGLKWLNSLE